MGIGSLFATFLGLFILILSPISYFVLKKLNFRKLGIAVSVTLALIVIIPTFSIMFESQLYFKPNARNDLKVIGITLNDNFEIIDNNIYSGSGNDLYQFTELKISKDDKARIISEIKKAKNFKIVTIEKTLAEEMKRVESKKIMSNYFFKSVYIRESYEKEKGYVPVRITINITNNSNILKLKRVG